MKLTDDMLRNAALEAAQYMDQKSVDAGKNQSHTFSPWFEREMETLMQKQKRQEERHKLFRYGRNVAAAVLVVIIALPLFNPAVRASYQDFFQVLIQQIDGYTEKFVVMKGDHMENEFMAAELGWIPDGMTKISDDREDTYFHQFYKSADGQYFGLDQQLVTVESGSVSWLDKDARVSEIELRGITATLTEDNGVISLVWHEKGYLMEISGRLSREDILKIAENIGIPKSENDGE